MEYISYNTKRAICSKERAATSTWKFRPQSLFTPPSSSSTFVSDYLNRDLYGSNYGVITDYVMIFAKADDDFHNLAQTLEVRSSLLGFHEIRFLATMAIENQEKTIREIQPKKTVKMVIHRDFRASNLLLDDNFLCNFNLTREGPQGGNTHVTAAKIARHGYTAPEYVQTGYYRLKRGLYELYEIITGQQTIEKKKPASLLEWVKEYSA
ncbi:hypothetical protein Bca52824_022254 [Brassica carinata]|uniref:Serine-threonine/tyrosine-protein kinase catalytic domain-containing protein n=1 Tax=Brassica carinata TaxID=52824 RepID=A0A8X7VG75_BRACI|nr:hypothetical protein Bca52824_022254 [Brassica carinata]